MSALLAAVIGGGGIGELLVWIIILAGIVAIVYIALRQFGITIPPFVVQIFWVVICVVLAVIAIRFLLTL